MKEKTQAAAGINSLNSIQWNPRILCNTSKGTWGTERAKKTTGHRRKSLASTVAHQFVLTSFHCSLSQDWWYAFFQSCSRPVLPSRDCALEYSFHTKFCLLTHHDVLECQPITRFLIAESLLLPKSCFSVLHAELIAELLLLSTKKTSFTLNLIFSRLVI